MSDHSAHPHNDCTRFADWLVESPDGGDTSPWQAHLDSCTVCREQWVSHQMLVATFAAEHVPELSPAFQAGLDRKLEAAIKVEPLTGWRRAALAAYAAGAVGLMVWIVDRFPLPQISIDYSSPWTLIAALALVPLSFWLTAAITRVLPAPRAKGARLLTI